MVYEPQSVPKSLPLVPSLPAGAYRLPGCRPCRLASGHLVGGRLGQCPSRSQHHHMRQTLACVRACGEGQTGLCWCGLGIYTPECFVWSGGSSTATCDGHFLVLAGTASRPAQTLDLNPEPCWMLTGGCAVAHSPTGCPSRGGFIFGEGGTAPCAHLCHVTRPSGSPASRQPDSRRDTQHCLKATQPLKYSALRQHTYTHTREHWEGATKMDQDQKCRDGLCAPH